MKMDAREIERSLITSYKKRIYAKFTRAVREYGLIKTGDAIAVCISGGKDSMLTAKCFQELKRHGIDNFELKFLAMDPGYSPEERALLEKNLEFLDIPAKIFNSDIYKTVANDKAADPCYLCARMRRGYLYSEAKASGCNKIALGHHFDDVIETVLLGIFYNGSVGTMMPKLKSKNFEGMELIRPLYFVEEKDIKAWAKYIGLKFLHCSCEISEKYGFKNGAGGRRQDVKKMIAEWRKTDRRIPKNIFNCVRNVMLDNVIRYKKDGVWHVFSDDCND